MIEGRFNKILRNLEIMKSEGEVVEIRMIKTKKGTISGYFDDYVELVKNIKPYIGENDIYMTLNPVKEDLLARCTNRLEPYAKYTSSDTDIERISYILIDLDPVRVSGISSTDEEKQAAYELAERIRSDLMKYGFSEPILADSGNGYHLLLSVAMENIAENISLVKEFLAALDFLYSNEKVVVDTTTYNPSRIVKVYGTKATKGDNTKERPHRWSKIIHTPTEIQVLDKEKLRLIVEKNPKKETSKIYQRNNSKVNIDAFIEEHKLDLSYKAPYNSSDTKYILKTCPWDSSHTDNSAFIIQFGSGAIAAGCHHNSCSEENWTTLKLLLDGETIEKSNVDIDNEKKSQSDVIVELANDFEYFKNELEDPFVAVDIDDHMEVMSVNSKRFQLYLTKLYYQQTQKVISPDSLKKAVHVLEMRAVFSENVRELQKRIAIEEGNYYYDLCDINWRAIKVSERGCSIIDKPPILFTRTKNMSQQLEPDFSVESKELVKLVKRHFRFKKDLDTLLFASYLVSCFLPQIAHIILVLFGEKGAAKSTTMRMVKRIVDPAMQDLLSMPTSNQDLAIVLSNNYFSCFDNLDTLTAGKSDMLCMAATGGAFSKRTLYSDSDETILKFKRCVALNGINIVATRADLLDRSIVLELNRISKADRKTEKEIWEIFEDDIPKFLGAIFNTIAAAIPIYENIELKEVGRMADFTYWGYAIAEVLGLGGENFLQAYLNNQDTANEEALSSHPVASAVIAMMKNRREWSSSVSALLRELELVAEREMINTRVKGWPGDANVLSKRLKEVKSNLEEIGIYFDIRHAGNYKKVTIENVKIEKKDERRDNGEIQSGGESQNSQLKMPSANELDKQES